jgi:hypothetical protein
MLKEQCTDATPLVGGFDREPHLRPWRRCVEGSVRADALVATDAYDALLAIGGRDHGGERDVRREVESRQKVDPAGPKLVKSFTRNKLPDAQCPQDQGCAVAENDRLGVVTE